MWAVKYDAKAAQMENITQHMGTVTAANNNTKKNRKPDNRT